MTKGFFTIKERGYSLNFQTNYFPSTMKSKEEILQQSGFADEYSKTHALAAMDEYAKEKVKENAASLCELILQAAGQPNANIDKCTIGDLRKAISDYAKNTIVEFQEWANKDHHFMCGATRDTKSMWFLRNRKASTDFIMYSTEQLFNIFMQQTQKNRQND